MAEAYFSVKNFDKFQHYKDRKPPWIKLYHETFEDYEFGGLPDASKMHLIAIWSLASRYMNKIPFDAEWIAKRINATEKVDLNLLVNAGFIELNQECSNMLAERYQSATLEKEIEKEPPLPPQGESSPKRRTSKKTRRTHLPENFPDEKAVDWAVKERGLSRQQAESEAQGFRDYWLGEGTVKADWMATWRGRINRALEQGRVTITAGGGALSPTAQDALERKRKREQQEGPSNSGPVFLAAGGMR